MEQPSGGRRLAWSAAIFALATGLSRVLGLVREIVTAYFFGAGGKINAFTVAFQVPNTVRNLLADSAVSSVFVPVFSELLEKGEAKRAWRVASTLFWLILLGLSGITALFMLLAPWVMELFGTPGGDLDLAVTLSRILFPTVVLLGLSGIIVGILNSYNHFTVPALTPVAWNLVIILGLVLGVPQTDSVDTQLYIYAGAVLLGTLVQVLLPLPWLRGRDDRLHMVIDWRDPAVKQTFVLLVPVTLGLGLINFNTLIDTLFASRLINPELAPTAIDKAYRLYLLPQGIFSIAIATVLFPLMSRLAARHDDRGFANTVGLGLRQIAFTLIPASVDFGGSGRADCPPRVPARRVHAAPDHCRGRRAGGLLRWPRVQRRDADADADVFQPAVQLDPDHHRPCEPGRERGARRGLLPSRDLGDPAGHLRGQHGRNDRADRGPPAPKAAPRPR